MAGEVLHFMMEGQGAFFSCRVVYLSARLNIVGFGAGVSNEDGTQKIIELSYADVEADILPICPVLVHAFGETAQDKDLPMPGVS